MTIELPEPDSEELFGVKTPYTRETVRRLISLAVAAERERLSKLAGEPVAYLSKHRDDVISLSQIAAIESVCGESDWRKQTPLHTADQIAAARLQGAEEAERQYGEIQSDLMKQVKEYGQRIKELESTVAEQLRTINAINDSGEPTLTVIKQLDAKDQRIAELEAELLEQARVNGMGGEREATLMAMVAVLEAQLAECKTDAERFQYLLEHHSYHYPMQPDSPAEHGIEYHWQQGSYEERNFGIRASLDAARTGERKI